MGSSGKGEMDAVREPLMRRKRASVMITYIHTRPDPSDSRRTVAGRQISRKEIEIKAAERSKLKEVKERRRKQKCARRFNSSRITTQPASRMQIGRAQSLAFGGGQPTKWGQLKPPPLQAFQGKKWIRGHEE